jgi:hypothetical protein
MAYTGPINSSLIIIVDFINVWIYLNFFFLFIIINVWITINNGLMTKLPLRSEIGSFDKTF